MDNSACHQGVCALRLFKILPDDGLRELVDLRIQLEEGNEGVGTVSPVQFSKVPYKAAIQLPLGKPALGDEAQHLLYQRLDGGPRHHHLPKVRVGVEARCTAPTPP